MNFMDFLKRFPTENDAIDYIIEKRYASTGYVCPNCGCVHERIYHQKYNRRYLYCSNCKYEFSGLTGTIFENTHIDFRKWLYAINLMMVSRKGVSAIQLQRELGLGSYKSAWRMAHQIRKAMQKEEFKDTFEAIVEIDETYVGGKPRKDNRHGDDDDTPNAPLCSVVSDYDSIIAQLGYEPDEETKKAILKQLKKERKRGRGTKKTPVVGVKERNSGRVHAVVALPDEQGKSLSGKQLFGILKKVCKDKTTVMTDQFSGYNVLDRPSSGDDKTFLRLVIDHSVAYSLENGIHTNGIESFWAVVKRGVYGIFHNISVKYMQRYIDEFCFRLNHRNENEAFETLVGLAVA